MKNMKLSDQELLKMYIAGDKASISVLIERHKKRITNYIYMLVRDQTIADDLFQETLIKAVRFIDEGRYTDNGKFLSWVLRIAHNQVIDYFRQNKHHNKVTESDAGYDILNSGKFAVDNVEDQMVSTQIQSDVRSLVEHLPQEQREVVVMRYYNDMSFKEISEATNVSINTALGRMRYALINLRKLISQKELILS